MVERCTAWYEDQLSAEKTSELLREKEKNIVETVKTRVPVVQIEEEDTLPVSIEMHVAEQIVVCKSMFVGQAYRITDPNQVSVVSALYPHTLTP